jgi:hypothetical protein
MNKQDREAFTALKVNLCEFKLSLYNRLQVSQGYIARTCITEGRKEGRKEGREGGSKQGRKKGRRKKGRKNKNKREREQGWKEGGKFEKPFI